MCRELKPKLANTGLYVVSYFESKSNIFYVSQSDCTTLNYMGPLIIERTTNTLPGIPSRFISGMYDISCWLLTKLHRSWSEPDAKKLMNKFDAMNVTTAWVTTFVAASTGVKVTSICDYVALTGRMAESYGYIKLVLGIWAKRFMGFYRKKSMILDRISAEDLTLSGSNRS